MKKLVLFIGSLILMSFVSLNVITGWKGVPTEAITIVYHYMFGNGEDLVLKSNYLPTSKVINDNLSNMEVGESKRVGFKQDLDWRLSYAINGFTLTKTNKGFKIEQYIKFDTTGTVYTRINNPFFDFNIDDNIVHFLDCTPFTVKYEYSN
jgi:hypothetical protein